MPTASAAPPLACQATSDACATASSHDAWHERLNRFVYGAKRDDRLQAAAKRHRLAPILAR